MPVPPEIERNKWYLRLLAGVQRRGFTTITEYRLTVFVRNLVRRGRINDGQPGGTYPGRDHTTGNQN